MKNVLMPLAEATALVARRRTQRGKAPPKPSKLAADGIAIQIEALMETMLQPSTHSGIYQQTEFARTVARMLDARDKRIAVLEKTLDAIGKSVIAGIR